MLRCVVSRGSRTASLLIAGHRRYATNAAVQKSDSTSAPVYSSAIGPRWRERTGEPDVSWQREEPFKSSESSHAVPKPISEATLDKSELEDIIHEELEDEYEGKEVFSGDGATLEEGLLEGISLSTEKLSSLLDEPDLPLSPFMNSEYFEARSKHRQPKLAPSKNPTAFQKQLSKNPYALALATPIRRCELTRTSLPSFFLQDFNLLAHPETNEPWWVPGRLTTKYRRYEYPTGKDENTVGPLVKEDGSEEHNVKDAERCLPTHRKQISYPEAKYGKPEQPLGIEYTVLPKSEPRNPSTTTSRATSPKSVDRAKLGPTTWVLQRQSLIRAMQTSGSGYMQTPWKKFNLKLHQIDAARRVLTAANWRSDMDTFIPELMRRRLREALEDLSFLKRGYTAGCNTWEEALMPGRQAAVILWTGPEMQNVLVDGDEEDIQIHGPPEFATVDIDLSGSKPPHDGQHRRSKIPVHNLKMILGRTHMRTLRKRWPTYEKELVILKDKRRVVDILMRLWRLEGYLATHKEFLPTEEVKQMASLLRQQAKAAYPKGFTGDPRLPPKGNEGQKSRPSGTNIKVRK